MKNERILFLGFARAGKEAFEELEKLGYSINQIRVYTHIHEENDLFINFLNKRSIPFHTASLKDDSSFELCKKFSPSHLVSIHYRDLVPARYLNLVNGRAMNLHPSLLPKYAGCLATMWAMINEETHSGITYHLMNEKFDQGNILLQKQILIEEDETGFSLFNKCIDVGIRHFKDAFDLLINNHPGKAQEGTGSYYPRKLPYNGLIDPSWSPTKIDRFIRAMIFPGKKGAEVLTAEGRIEVKDLKEYLKHV